MSLLDLFRAHRVSFRESGRDHHVSSGWVGLQCPWCGPNSGSYHLGINLQDGRCSCWKCGRHSSIDAVRKLCGASLQEISKHFQPRSIQPKTQQTEHTGTLKYPDRIGPLQQIHKQYLERRRFDSTVIERLWGVLGIGICNKLPWRLFIPIRDAWGTPVSWTTRSIGSENPRRYISAGKTEEAVSHKTLLYGADLARHAVVIVEGPLDAWAIGPGAVATCGTAYTPEQLSAMTLYPIRTVCFDSSPDAQARAQRLCEYLCMFPGTTENILLETGDDPADAEPEEIQQLRSAYLEI